MDRTARRRTAPRRGRSPHERDRCASTASAHMMPGGWHRVC